MPYKDKEKGREWERKYRAIHRDKHNEYNRKYYDSHREQMQERNRKYSASHKEQIKEYRANRKEWNRNRLKKYYAKHKDLMLCTRCCLPAAKNSTRCLLHMSLAVVSGRKHRSKNGNKLRHSKTNKERRDRLKKENRCVDCGMPLDDESRSGICCLNCRAKKGG